MRGHGRSTRAARACVVAVSLLLGGCAQTGGKDVGNDSGAIGLVNLWRVSGAVGEAPNTWGSASTPPSSSCGATAA